MKEDQGETAVDNGREDSPEKWEDGGVSWSCIMSGWLAALGAGLLLSSIASGVIVAGYAGGGSASGEHPLGRAVFLLTIFLSFMVGGYVAAKMAGRAEIRHAIFVPVFGLAATAVLTLVGAAVGIGLMHGLGGVTLPEFPQDARQSFSTLLSVQGILALLLVPFIGGVLGGLCGAQDSSSPGTGGPGTGGPGTGDSENGEGKEG